MDLHQPPPPPAQHNRWASDVQSQAQTGRQSSSAAQGQACQRCRQQKLRCSRESPKCTRCQRATAACIYPAPPDRKLLAAQRVRKSRFRPYQEPRSSTAPPDQDDHANIRSSSAVERSSTSAEEPPNLNDGFVAPRPDEGQHHRPWAAPAGSPPSHIAAAAASRPTPAPSPEVARLLIEMYFTRAYNAALLFHKETFLSDYAANKLPGFITHAVFALASIFLPTPSRDSRIEGQETELGISALSTSGFGDYAQEWAMAASQQVLMQAIEPNMQTIQACQVLALYWFSKDARDHAHILTNLAYTSCRLLGYHIPRAEITDGGELLAELKRRCLWSCWMTACISQENASFKSDSWTEVVGLPLPTDETSFAAGTPETFEIFNELGKVVPYNVSSRTGQISIMGELVKLLSLWWQTQRFVRHYQDGYPSQTNTSDRLQEFLKLDRRLETISENFHPELKYSGPSSFTSPKLDPYILFSLQSLYRLCACTLHSSFVPLFSSTPADPEISKKLVRMCAEQAVKHSVITLDMATAFLSTHPDKSRLSSMTGFAMFVTSLIQIRSLGAQGTLKAHAGHLKAAVSILKELNQYWTPLRALWTKLWLVSSFAGLDFNTFAVCRNDAQIASAGIQTDIEQIVSSEAVSENGPGADLYTYVERREPRVASQQSSPANIAPQIVIGQTLRSPKNGNNSGLDLQSSQRQREKVGQVNSKAGPMGGALTMPEASPFPPVYPQETNNLQPQQSLQGRFDQELGATAGNIQRQAETMQLQMAGSNTNMQLYGAPMIPQTMSLEQGSAFRPMMDGFDTMNGMMGINMDLNNDDDDFWWSRSWGSVRIL